MWKVVLNSIRRSQASRFLGFAALGSPSSGGCTQKPDDAQSSSLLPSAVAQQKGSLASQPPLPPSPASSKSRIYPQSFPQPILLLPTEAYPTSPHPQLQRRIPNCIRIANYWAPASPKPPRFALFLSNALPNYLPPPPPPSSLGKPQCLQVSACKKGNGEEPFNLFSHLKIQTGSRSLHQEVSALGERAAMRCHLLEMIILHYWKREGKDPCVRLGTGRRAGAAQEAGF